MSLNYFVAAIVIFSGTSSFAQMNLNDMQVATTLGLNLVKTTGVVTENHESCSREVKLVNLGNMKVYQLSIAFGNTATVIPVGKLQYKAPSPSSPGHPPARPQGLLWQVSPSESYVITADQRGQITKMGHLTGAAVLTCEFKIAAPAGIHTL